MTSEAKFTVAAVLYALGGAVAFGHAINQPCPAAASFAVCDDRQFGAALGALMLWPLYLSDQLWKKP